MTERSAVRYELVLPPSMTEDLRGHLLSDRSVEQMAIVLCGLHEGPTRTRFLGRHLILMPPEAFARQSAGGLALRPEVQRHVLTLAARERLSQIDFHTHPGESDAVAFSSIDNRHEEELARYLAERMPGTRYGSVVMNGRAASARIWEIRDGRASGVPIPPPALEGLSMIGPSRNGDRRDAPRDGRFDRQVRAFGPEFQRRLESVRVGLVGVGGLGSVLVEELARLGVRDWVLVDPDHVAASNLNRLLGATPRDAEEEISKVEVARRTIRRIDQTAKVQSIRATVFTTRALRALRDCDLLVAATDDDASRLAVNALACQYLRTLVHVGVHLAPKREGGLEDASGEVAVPPLGRWCLLCGGVIDAQRAAWDLASPEERELLRARGYLDGTPAPAVYHLNALTASLAAAEIHNVVFPYKPLRRYLVYRELEAELMSIEVPARETCLHCTPEGLLGLGDLAPLWRPRRSGGLTLTRIPDGRDHETLRVTANGSGPDDDESQS